MYKTYGYRNNILYIKLYIIIAICTLDKIKSVKIGAAA